MRLQLHTFASAHGLRVLGMFCRVARLTHDLTPTAPAADSPVERLKVIATMYSNHAYIILYHLVQHKKRTHGCLR